MSFPQVASITVYNGGGTQVTPHPIVMPATVNAGDLLLILFDMESGSSPTTPAGWNVVFGPTDGENAGSSYAVGYAKVADGTEDGATVNIGTTSTSFGIAHTYRITNWHGVYATGVGAGTPATGTDTNANPPAVTASWGVADNLFIACAAYYDDLNTSAAPSNYANLQYDECANSLAIPSIASARRELAAGSDDPGPFTQESGFWVAETIVIRGLAGGSGGGGQVKGGGKGGTSGGGGSDTSGKPGGGGPKQVFAIASGRRRIRGGVL